jgi:hypothetical protein
MGLSYLVTSGEVLGDIPDDRACTADGNSTDGSGLFVLAAPYFLSEELGWESRHGNLEGQHSAEEHLIPADEVVVDDAEGHAQTLFD